ncbi:MAG: DUF2218 domain-containing protein [Hyphomicrobiales bacterium]|jgi:hypothetical protein
MSETTAIVTTQNASRYLQQLCKHFSHKVEVQFTPEAGTVALPFGTCRLSADAEKLVLTGSSEKSNLPKLERFLGNHLARFAFRENPTITWQRAA